MRVAFLNDEHPRVHSSVARFTGETAAALRGLGHETLIITTHRAEESPEIVREEGIVSIPVSYRKVFRHWRCLRSRRVEKEVDRALAKFQPDAVHANNVHAYLTYGSLLVARRHAKSVILTAHDVMLFAFGRVTTKRFLDSGGKDTRLTVWDHWNAAGVAYNPFRNWIIRRILKKSACTVAAVSNALARALKEHGIPNVITVHHGMDASAKAISEEQCQRFRERFGLSGKKVILFGGRLRLDKGTTPLLHAFLRVSGTMPNISLLILGEEERWASIVDAAKLPNTPDGDIRVTGWLKGDELKTAYAVTDVVTTPSLCLDTFNLMNLEAMEAGKPVVGTIFGGTPEIVEDGNTGFVCDPRNVPVYADLLTKILCAPANARQMGTAGRKRAEKLFSRERCIGDYVDLYTQPNAYRPA